MKERIKNSIQKFDLNNFYESSLTLFNSLGYDSDKRSKLGTPNFNNFIDQFRIDEENISKEKALVSHWKEIQFLFQISDDDISNSDQLSVFHSKNVDKNYLKSYLFISISLKENKYTKTDLVNITRQINKQFLQPVLILFHYNNQLCLSVIDRRLNKKDSDKDVLEKVTLIKDIRIDKPHRAHIEILNDLHLSNLNVNNFDELHKAFKTVLDIKELNEAFYQDITKWYYYAVQVINLPFKPEYYKTKTDHNKYFTVKLLSRMLFIWFLKEKGLINNKLLELFDYNGNNRELLSKVFNKEFLESNNYYRGILQTLFYNCLNTELPSNGHRTIKQLKSKFLPEFFEYTLFEKIPFLNGGLFDQSDDHNYNENIEDSVINIPNELFYAGQITYKSGNKTIQTKGLNRILAKYKFTVSENTPLEEEVALDPELLGLVFENLLAELDSDNAVSKNARKEAGAYYTPRKIIDYMVNESLLLYLNKCAVESEKEEYKELNKFLVYHNIINENDSEFENFIVESLDKIKVLDPACGSGAFPMGMLHRIVSLLNVVDKDNEKWLHLKMKNVEAPNRRKFESILKKHFEDYSRKLWIIRDSIYGLDIEPLAIQITKLRFFISLIIDQTVDWDNPKENYHITPLPNLETKIICADSLQNMESDWLSSQAEDELKVLKEQYYDPEITQKEKTDLVDTIAEKLNVMYPDFCSKVFPNVKHNDATSKEKANIQAFKEWFHFGNFPAPFTDFNVFFPELEHTGFDIVIGNPPYGGTKIPDSLKTQLGLASKDPYGAFLSRFISSDISPLVENGVLAFIVSDTFMTIKSHFPLRKIIMRNKIHKMIRVHPDTFKATVNTAMTILQHTKEESKAKKNTIQMVDLTNISIHENYSRYLDILYETLEKADDYSFSSSEYAIYHYPQNLITTNTHLPFFVGSPKLFRLMNNTNAPFEDREIDGKKIRVRKIEMNKKIIEIVRFGDVAEIKQGLATGDNQYYLYQNPEARGNYNNIKQYKEFLLSDEELIKISKNDEIRMKVINQGFHKSKTESNFDSDLWFDGKYIVPYDKGGESDIKSGWLPNYYVPTNYFIDWSCEAVIRMKTFISNKQGGKIASRFQNKDYYCIPGLTWSDAGFYSPTIRLSGNGVFDVKGSRIVISSFENTFIIALLTSKLLKMWIKNINNHTVSTQVDDFRELGISKPFVNQNTLIIKLVEGIISSQRQNPRYDYAGKEQIEIDKLVYEMYGLNEEDIQEVENWYARRYPKLVRKK